MKRMKRRNQKEGLKRGNFFCEGFKPATRSENPYIETSPAQKTGDSSEPLANFSTESRIKSKIIYLVSLFGVDREPL